MDVIAIRSPLLIRKIIHRVGIVSQNRRGDAVRKVGGGNRKNEKRAKCWKGPAHRGRLRDGGIIQHRYNGSKRNYPIIHNPHQMVLVMIKGVGGLFQNQLV